MYKNIGGMLVLPVLVSLFFDIYGTYLMVSGSWTIMIEFLYPVVALLAAFWTFGLLLRTKSLFRVAFVLTTLGLIGCMAFVFFIHGVERTNLIRTTFIHGLSTPIALGVSILLELDNVVSIETSANKYITLLNRTWIYYFVASYAEWNMRFFTLQIENVMMKRYVEIGLEVFHISGYCAILICYLYAVNKTNLNSLWKIPQTS
ncbi:MAG: hypothetical protein HWE14_00695 [Flavobacteriia bacterium]|nr:hypothetical protein [Flavobacteriia bacterium]